MENTEIYTPELRFPEFEEEWAEKKLGEIGKFVGGGTPSSNNSEYWSGNIPWISSSDIYENNNQKINISRFITEDAISNSATKLVPKGSVLLVSRVGIGKFAVANEDLCTSQDFTNLITQEDSFFLAYYFIVKSNRFLRLSQGTSIKGFTGKDIKNAKFLIPSLPEQQKIASFLTAVDKQIELLKEKKSQLGAYKKGVMQRLFLSASEAQESGIEPLRFKNENGQDFPDWEEKRLGELYDFKSTNSLSRDKLNYEGGEVKNIHYGDIHSKFQTHFDIEREYVPFINSDIDLDKINSENYVQEGDLVIADASEDYADIGKTIEVVNINNEKLLAGLHTFLARRKSDSLTLGFGGHMMKNYSLRLDIMRIAQGTKVLSLATGRMNNLVVKIPSFPEQKKIASFLSGIDTQIGKLDEQIISAEEFKRGLLQKMFV